MTTRDRIAQARHAALLSGDAPVLNRCAKEETHLKQRLAQSTAAYASLTHQSHAAAAKEERTRSARLQAQFTALLSNTPGVVLPSQSTSLTAENAGLESLATNAAAASPATAPTASPGTSGALVNTAASRGFGSSELPHPEPCALGFPDAYESSGFKSIIRWASIAFDETYLTAYGPRRVREAAQTHTYVSSGGAQGARGAQPHRLMAAVACYLLNEVLCADPAVADLWQTKLREPIFDAVFSSQPITSGQERQRQCRGPCADPAVADAIVDRTIGTTSSPLASVASGVGATTNAVLVDKPFPPRTNMYESRDDFAALRLWTEEVASEQREKLAVCNRVRGLQHAMARRQMAVHLFQRRARQAEVRGIFIVWRTYTRQRRTILAAMERYLVNRSHRYMEETIFLRWRRFTLRAKVEALQRRLLNIAADRDRAAREHAAAQQALQDQLASERRHNQQVLFERDTLHAQVLDGHAVEVDALRLMLHMERMQTMQSSKWARRWERAAKTFRPAQPCPAMPRGMWSIGRALLTSEEAFAAVVLRNAGDQQTLLQMPYTMIFPARERFEQLLLLWVNWIMETSPNGSSWITVEAFMHGYGSHPRSILQQQKTAQSKAVPQAAAQAKSGTALGNGTCEFGIYTLMSVVRELRRRYAQAGLVDKAVRRYQSRSASMANAAAATAQECLHELTYILAAQTCGGLYPPLLSHCSTLSAWLTAEGVFGGPTTSFEGTKRQQRQQHTTFLWLLSSLLVGHVQVMWMAPPGDKGTFSFSSTRPVGNRGNSATAAAWLRCKHETEMMQLARLNFPVKNGHGAGGVAAAGASPTTTTTNPTSTSAAAGRGTTIVARNTLVSKKRSTMMSSAAASSARIAAKAAAEEADAAAMISATEMTLEEMLRVRYKATRASLSVSSNTATTLVGRELLLSSEDSLTDIEAFLGIVPVQLDSLKNRAAANTGTTGASAARPLTMGSGADDDDDDENDEDRLINGLLHQLFAAEDAEAEMRRTMRLQRRSVQDLCAVGNPDMETEEPPEGAMDEHPFADSEPFSFLAPRAVNASAHEDLAKSSIALADEQLQLLRGLPGRSHGFDTLRPVAAPAVTSEDGTAQQTAPATDSAATPLYSFLLNMLDDTTTRQQWRGLARVVSSLVVRFRVLDEAEDAVRRAAALAAAKEEEELKSNPPRSRPSSVQRGDGFANTVPAAARLPPVHSAGFTSAAAATLPSPYTPLSRSREWAIHGPAAATTTGAGGRVAAQVVPAFSPLSSPLRQEETSPRRHDSRATSSSADTPLAGRWNPRPAPAMSTISTRLGDELRARGAPRPASLVSMQDTAPAAEAEHYRLSAPAGVQASPGSPPSATPSLISSQGRYQREHQRQQQQSQHHREESSSSSATTQSAGTVSAHITTPTAADAQNVPIIPTATLLPPSSEPGTGRAPDALTQLHAEVPEELRAAMAVEGNMQPRALLGPWSSRVSTSFATRGLSAEDRTASRPGSARTVRVTVQCTEPGDGTEGPLTDAPERHGSDSSLNPLSPERRARQQRQRQLPQPQQQRLPTSSSSAKESSRKKPLSTTRVPSSSGNESCTSARDVATTMVGGSRRHSSTASALTVSASLSSGHFIPPQVTTLDDLPPAPRCESGQVPAPQASLLAASATPVIAIDPEAPPAEGEKATSPPTSLEPLVIRPDQKAPPPATRKDHFRMS